jgi:hypothetical protein
MKINLKSLVLGILIGILFMVTIPFVNATVDEHYNVPTSLTQMVEKALSNAESKDEYNRVSEILRFISNPLVISSGPNFNPNGKYNFGLSVYEKSIDRDGNITWTRTN